MQLLVLLVVSLLTSSAISAQEATEKNALLTKFKKRYQQINQYKKYKTVSIENSEEFLGDCSVNGGNLSLTNDLVKSDVKIKAGFICNANDAFPTGYMLLEVSPLFFYKNIIAKAYKCTCNYNQENNSDKLIAFKYGQPCSKERTSEIASCHW